MRRRSISPPSARRMLEAGPPIISSIMGLYPESFVARMKQRGITWFATATTVAEARAAEAAGADVVIAQGMEAGGHRGCLRGGACGDAVGRAIRPAARDSRCREGSRGCNRRHRRCPRRCGRPAAGCLRGAGGHRLAALPRSCDPNRPGDAIGRTPPEDTMVSRAFSGRPGRTIANAYVRAATGPDAPRPHPIRCSGRSHSPCAKRPSRRTTSTACRLGPANPQRWRALRPPGTSCAGSGRMRRHCCGKSNRRHGSRTAIASGQHHRASPAHFPHSAVISPESSRSRCAPLDASCLDSLNSSWRAPLCGGVFRVRLLGAFGLLHD